MIIIGAFVLGLIPAAILSLITWSAVVYESTGNGFATRLRWHFVGWYILWVAAFIYILTHTT